MVQRIRLGELLVRAGVLEEAELANALQEQMKWGGRLGKVLLNLGYVEESVMVRALSKQLGLPMARLDQASVPASLLERLDPEVAKDKGYCPERWLPEDKTLVVAMVDPSDVSTSDELAFRLGVRVRPTIVGELELAHGIKRLFFGESQDIQPSAFAVMSTGADRGPFSNLELEPLEAVGDGPDWLERPRGAPTVAPSAPTGGPAATAERFAPPPERFGPPPTPPARSEASQGRFGPLPEPTPAAPGRFEPPPSGGGRFDAPPTLSNAPEPVSPPSVWSHDLTSPGVEPETMSEKLSAAQRRQNRVLRAMIDILIDRGVFTEAELRQRLLASRSKR